MEGQTGSPPPGQSQGAVTDQLTAITLGVPARRRWWIGFILSAVLVALFMVSVGGLFMRGVGIWGVNISVFWGVAIINTVWWAGIAHAGTVVSALLLLAGQEWRTSLNRFAEAMTVFAVFCAALFPVLHLGRPWTFYWMFPYPAAQSVWPQFRSPLEWDIFAFVAYLIVSIVFWYVGLIPDVAAVRDRARSRGARVFYGVLALGWRNSAHHWLRWRQLYFVAALAALLVVTLHSGAAMLFASSLVPGWHTTIFPPLLMLGSVFSGTAMIAVLAVTLRGVYRLHNLITLRHLDLLGQFLLAAGLMTIYAYVFGAFTAWYSTDPRAIQTLIDRAVGEYAWSFWAAAGLSFGTIQLLWWRGLRERPLPLFLVSLAVTVGMWFERYMLLITGLYRDFIPARWGLYDATFWDWSLQAGTVGIFLFGFFLFLRFLPLVSIAEVKEVLHDRRRSEEEAHG